MLSAYGGQLERYTHDVDNKKIKQIIEETSKRDFKGAI
jgi:hypothetical protein